MKLVLVLETKVFHVLVISLHVLKVSKVGDNCLVFSLNYWETFFFNYGIQFTAKLIYSCIFFGHIALLEKLH